MTVESSGLGAQPVGEAAEVAEGVYQLKVPVPIPLVFVSAYLVRGDDGWTLIDTGFDYPDGRAAWEAGAEAVGCDLRRDVERIVVTHFHPDHLGAARWLQGVGGAPVYMLEGEIPHSREIWETADPETFIGHLARHGWSGPWPRRPLRGQGRTSRCRRRCCPCGRGRRWLWAPGRRG